MRVCHKRVMGPQNALVFSFIKFSNFFLKFEHFREIRIKENILGGGSQWEIGKSENDEIPGLGMLEIKGRIDIATFTINE